MNIVRLPRLAALVAAVVVLTVGAASAARPLPTKTVEVKGITVEVTPRRVDARGAVIEITLDTHESDLNTDLQKRSTLTVDGTPWPVAAYRGDGPGGHHREGMLRFRSAGRAAGSIRLVITGLGRTVRFTWRLPTSG